MHNCGQRHKKKRAEKWLAKQWTKAEGSVLST